jgi:hypothetical protein
MHLIRELHSSKRASYLRVSQFLKVLGRASAVGERPNKQYYRRDREDGLDMATLRCSAHFCLQFFMQRSYSVWQVFPE